MCFTCVLTTPLCLHPRTSTPLHAWASLLLLNTILLLLTIVKPLRLEKVTINTRSTTSIDHLVMLKFLQRDPLAAKAQAAWVDRPLDHSYWHRESTFLQPFWFELLNDGSRALLDHLVVTGPIVGIIPLLVAGNLIVVEELDAGKFGQYIGRREAVQEERCG